MGTSPSSSSSSSPAIFISFICIYYLAAIAKIEYSEENNTQIQPLYNDTTFSFSCIGSGNDRIMFWEKDNGEFPDGEFEMIKDELVDGDYLYGQAIALEQVWIWDNPPGESATCDDVDQQNGVYTCKVWAQAGDKETQAHASFTLDVQCKISLY